MSLNTGPEHHPPSIQGWHNLPSLESFLEAIFNSTGGRCQRDPRETLYHLTSRHEEVTSNIEATYHQAIQHLRDLQEKTKVKPPPIYFRD